MSIKVNCLNPIAACGLDMLGDNYEITENTNEAEAILVRSAGMHDMDLPESLLAVARAGAGVNNIPLDACAEKGIVVFNTPGANANGVKEAVLAGLFLGARDMGYGGCMLMNIKRTELMEIFGLDPEKYAISMVIALGVPVEEVKMVEVKDDDIKYYRDENQVHYVPKRSLKDVIVKEL